MHFIEENYRLWINFLQNCFVGNQIFIHLRSKMKVVTKMILASTILSMASSMTWAQDGPPPPMPPPPPGLPIDEPALLVLFFGLIYGIYRIVKARLQNSI